MADSPSSTRAGPASNAGDLSARLYRYGGGETQLLHTPRRPGSSGPKRNLLGSTSTPRGPGGGMMPGSTSTPRGGPGAGGGSSGVSGPVLPHTNVRPMAATLAAQEILSGSPAVTTPRRIDASAKKTPGDSGEDFNNYGGAAGGVGPQPGGRPPQPGSDETIMGSLGPSPEKSDLVAADGLGQTAGQTAGSAADPRYKKRQLGQQQNKPVYLVDPADFVNFITKHESLQEEFCYMNRVLLILGKLLT